MYYVEISHPAIIDKEIWKAVQLEMKRRKNYMEIHRLETRFCKGRRRSFYREDILWKLW